MSDIGMARTSDARFGIGRVLRNTFGVIGRNPVNVFLLSAAVTAFTLAANHWLGRGVSLLLLPAYDPALARFAAGVAGILLSLVTNGALATAVTVIAINDLNGTRTGLGAALRVALRLLPAVAVLGIVVYLGFLLGLVLLVVPGIMLLVRWSVVVPVRVAEDVGIGGALSRSAALTKGHRWKIFALFLVVGVMLVLVGLAELAYSGGPVEMVRLQAALDPGFLLMQVVVTSTYAAVSTSLIAAIYVELRRTKEGALPNELAAVFE